MSKLMQFVLIYLDYLHVKNYTKIRSFQTYIYIYYTNQLYYRVYPMRIGWEQKSNVRSKLYEIRDGGCRLIDRIANVFSRPRVKKRVKSSGT